jgi:hypothetical protein
MTLAAAVSLIALTKSSSQIDGRTMASEYRTGAYIKVADSGFDAELRLMIADREIQGKVGANIIEAFAKVFAEASADMKKVRRHELAPPIRPHQFFVSTDGRD